MTNEKTPYKSIVATIVIVCLVIAGFLIKHELPSMIALFVFLFGCMSYWIMDFADIRGVHVIKVIGAMTIAILALSIAGYTAFTGNITKTEVQSDWYDIYNVDAPFGILWREISGSAGYFLVFGAAHLETNLQETYNVKYFFDSAHTELKTEQLNAQKTSIIVDGTFKLEYRIIEEITINPYYGKQGGSRYAVFFIHIPALPNVNGTTEEYKVVG